MAPGARSRKPPPGVEVVEELPKGQEESIEESNQPKKKKGQKRAKEESAPKEEKRLSRFRTSCPKSLSDRFTRALQQRMYLVSKEPVVAEDGTTTSAWKFGMLGSTGNVYEVMLCQQPTCNCPDFLRRSDLCKHLIFVLLRVVGLSPEDPLAYQKAYLSHEVQDLLERVQRRFVVDPPESDSVWANSQVRNEYAKHLTQESDNSNQDSNGVVRRSLDQDCPICLENLSDCPLNQVTFCRLVCGMNFHIQCMDQWRRAAGNKNGSCPNCRAVETNDDDNNTDKKKEPYVNLGRLQGLNSKRDTSTYHSYSPSSKGKRQRRQY